MSGGSAGRQVIFVDGVCVLCHSLVRFLLKIDRRRVLTFATLQGEAARRVFSHTPFDRERRLLASVLYVRNCGAAEQRIHRRSTAALLALRDIGGVWWWVSWLCLIPRPLRDLVYRMIARCRYRCFGKHEDACPLPAQDESDRFLA